MVEQNDGKESDVVNFAAARQGKLPMDKLTDSERAARLDMVAKAESEIKETLTPEERDLIAKGERPDLTVVERPVDPTVMRMYKPVFDLMARRDEEKTPDAKVLKLPGRTRRRPQKPA